MSRGRTVFVVVALAGFALAPVPVRADNGPVIVIPSRPGIPIVINGRDASYAVVEGDWGLSRPGAVPVTVIGGSPLVPNSVYRPRNSYIPRYGRAPERGRISECMNCAGDDHRSGDVPELHEWRRHQWRADQQQQQQPKQRQHEHQQQQQPKHQLQQQHHQQQQYQQQ